MQQLCGFLNFLCRCIVPGCAFTRRLYSKFSSSMKPHHHISINREMKEDLNVWKNFLQHPSVYCHPFIDYSVILQATDIDMFTDTSGSIGCGGIYTDRWFQMKWSPAFLKKCKPSIEFLELFAVTVAVLNWAKFFANRRICLFMDNETIMKAINNSSSRCRNCMFLIRKIVMVGLQHNVWIFAKHVRSKMNYFADSLSRFQQKRFAFLTRRHYRTFRSEPDEIPQELLPIEDNRLFEWLNFRSPEK